GPGNGSALRAQLAGARHWQLLYGRARRRPGCRHRRYEKGDRDRPETGRRLSLAGRQSAQGPAQCRGTAGVSEIARAQPKTCVGDIDVEKDPYRMKTCPAAAAIAVLALLSFYQFPGHTWLQQDSQIYVPILEHLRDPSVLGNDILVERPHVTFTL